MVGTGEVNITITGTATSSPLRLRLHSEAARAVWRYAYTELLTGGSSDYFRADGHPCTRL